MRADARFVLFPQFLERKFNDMSEEIEIKDEVLDLKVTDKYDENQIQVLEGLEAVRKRPGMYIGSTSARGLHHLVYEIVDNSIDEALAGYCTHIEVTIEKGDIIRVADNGRGIPCGIHPQMGIPTLEVVLTVLHAGGKFDGSGYKVSGGLHGVGSSVVNALSDWLEAEVRDGHTKHYMRFERGVTTVKMRGTPCESETGTTIRFHADPEIFETTIYEYDVLEKRLREQAFLNAGLKITLRDERDDEPVGRYPPVCRAPQPHEDAAARECDLHGGQPRYLDGRGCHAVHRQLQRADAVLRKQYQHHRGRHA